MEDFGKTRFFKGVEMLGGVIDLEGFSQIGPLRLRSSWRIPE
jgi:hypothetical protein